MSRKKWIKEGVEVAHYENLEQKMIVESFIKEVIPESSEVQEDYTTSQGNRVFMRHVVCHWWEGKSPEKVFKQGKFHTRELVPWDVAQQGYVAVMKFMG